MIYKYKTWAEGDECIINFGSAGCIENCKFVQSFFDNGCTYYEIDVFPFLHEPDNIEHYSRILVRSIYVEEPLDRFKGKSQILNSNIRLN